MVPSPEQRRRRKDVPPTQERLHGAVALQQFGQDRLRTSEHRVAEQAVALCGQLVAGDVEAAIAFMRRLWPSEQRVKDETRKAIDCFHTNAEHMRYACFRSQDLFIGSGLVKEGCKTIAAQRLKKSGLRWTVRSLNVIIVLRCCQLIGAR